MSFDQLLILGLIAVVVAVAMAILATIHLIRMHSPVHGWKYKPIEWPPTFDDILSDSSTHYWCR